MGECGTKERSYDMSIYVSRWRVLNTDTPTIDALEPTTRWGIDIITVGTKELHGVKTWQVRSSTWHNMASTTVNTRAAAKHTLLVFLDLKRNPNVSIGRVIRNKRNSPSPANPLALR